MYGEHSSKYHEEDQQKDDKGVQNWNVMSVGIVSTFAIQVEVDALKIGPFLVKDCDFLFQYDYGTD